MLGRAPWRCRHCGRRFTAPSEAEVESRRRHRTLAGYLGIRDPKQRRRLNQRLIGLVAAVSALVLALGLLRYCASETRPPEGQAGSSSARPALADPQPSG
jgi:hypothetical protein